MNICLALVMTKKKCILFNVSDPYLYGCHVDCPRSGSVIPIRIWIQGNHFNTTHMDPDPKQIYRLFLCCGSGINSFGSGSESYRYLPSHCGSDFLAELWIRIRIRIRIESGFNGVPGSGSGSGFAIRIRIRIQQLKN